MNPLLEISDLSFGYEGSSALVFESLDLRVMPGEFILVKGPSGSGKSTLLRLICRLNKPLSGTILFQGSSVSDIPPARLRSSVSYVAQTPQLIDASVLDNLLLPFSFASNAAKKNPERVALQAMLREFYLDGITLEHSALKLSLGQKQRLAIMRALLQEPVLLLLDEPTSALDKESAAMVFAIMERLNTRQQRTLITVTHLDYTPETLRPRTCTLAGRTLVCHA
ncbi:MAG: ABC transporter ATP-binding protein [Chlorobiaceae bacterium]